MAELKINSSDLKSEIMKYFEQNCGLQMKKDPEFNASQSFNDMVAIVEIINKFEKKMRVEKIKKVKRLYENK